VPEFPLRSIVVVGGGTTGALAAATLARVLGGSCPIRLVSLPDVDESHGAIASVPSLHRLMRLLRIDPAEMMRATGATFRLGAMFRDWSALGDRYFNGLGTFGARLDAVPFQHHWLRQVASGDRIDFEQFSMSAQLAKLDRFALPQADPRSVLSLYSYAWHFDADLLANYLRGRAIKDGVVEIPGDVANVALDSEGNIRELVLADGNRLDGDLFVDCSGARTVLGSALGSVTEDWSAWLPCDRMQWLRAASRDPLPPYSETVAEASGWSSSIPLQRCTVHSQVYCSEFTSDADIAAKLSAVPGAESGAPQLKRIVRGRPREFWLRNCLLLPGDSIDALDGTSLHLAQSGITRFLAHFPVARSSPTDAEEYNRQTTDEYDRLRDLLVLHYHTTRRSDSPFWNRCRETKVPDSLARKLELFADSGRITVAEDDHCGVDGWLTVLLGKGLLPRSYDPLAETMPLATAQRAFAGIAAEMRTRAASLPLHRDFIARCGASAPP
jgi:tryptophan halogenase